MYAPSELVTGGRVDIRHTGMLVSFDGPRRVLSTGICNGGLHWLRHCYNHRLTEFFPHERDFPGGSVRSYLELSLLQRGVSPSNSTAMLTSARMDWHSYSCHSHENIRVECLLTAGVEQTAARAGDPAYYYEQDGSYYPVGTINAILSTNASLPDSIIAKTFLTVTEAKAAALQDCGIASLRTGLPATGTGTDGLMVAADPFGPRLTDAGTHSRFGEMLARAMYDSLFATFRDYPLPWNSFPSLRPARIAAEKLAARRTEHGKDAKEHHFDSK